MKDSKKLDLMGRGLAWENVTKAKTNSAGNSLMEIAPRIAAMESEVERLKLMLQMAYCQKIGADAPNGLDCCDDYRDWLTTLKTPNMSIYTENGYKNRRDYLECLADDYGVEYSVVANLAGLLGADEDWDGLVNALEDYVETLE